MLSEEARRLTGGVRAPSWAGQWLGSVRSDFFGVWGEGDLMTPPCLWLLDFHPGSSPENSGNSSKETLLLMVALIDS